MFNCLISTVWKRNNIRVGYIWSYDPIRVGRSTSFSVTRSLVYTFFVSCICSLAKLQNRRTISVRKYVHQDKYILTYSICFLLWVHTCMQVGVCEFGHDWSDWLMHWALTWVIVLQTTMGWVGMLRVSVWYICNSNPLLCKMPKKDSGVCIATIGPGCLYTASCPWQRFQLCYYFGDQ